MGASDDVAVSVKHLGVAFSSFPCPYGCSLPNTNKYRVANHIARQHNQRTIFKRLMIHRKTGQRKVVTHSQVYQMEGNHVAKVDMGPTVGEKRNAE